jgi:hypothetical protein
MRYLVQRENVALFAVILGLFADCSSSLTTFWAGEAEIPVTALLDQKGDMLLGSGDSLRNSLAVILENIRPIIETLPLAQAADAYARMMQGKARLRMVLVTKDGVAQEASVNG